MITIRKLLLFAEGLACVACAAFLVVYLDSVETDQSENRRARLAEPSVVKIEDSSKSQQHDYANELGLTLSHYVGSRAHQALTLYPTSGDAKIALLDMHGKVLHTWNIDADRVRLLPNGNILCVHGTKWGLKRKPWKQLRPVVAEYNWNGERVWQYRADDVIHHDVQRLSNGNTLFLKRTILPIHAMQGVIDPERAANPLRGDSIIEVDSSGQIVWSWHAHEHLDVNDCGKHNCGGKRGTVEGNKKLKDWTHMNTVSPLPENRWYAAGDERFRPGNILAMLRNWSTVILIDKDTKRVVWEYTGDYRGGLGGGHEPHMIEEGLPGAGNILIFDNGTREHTGQSIILEIEPPTKRVMWKYENGNAFHSRAAGSVQRLTNGNTFISQDNAQRMFEVTPSGEIVWEAHGPYRINRARRYATDYLASTH